MKNDYVVLEKAHKTSYLSNMRKHPLFGYVLIILILLLLQLSFMAGMNVITLTISRALVTTMIYTIAIMGLGILLGLGGMVSLGTAAFIGLGAYIAGNLLRSFTSIPFLLIMLITILVAIVLGIVIGFVSLRVKGLHLMVITLAFSSIMLELFMIPNDFTGGPMGISGIPFPTLATFIVLNRETVFFLVLAVLFVMIILTMNIINSPIGRALLAMASSEPLAQAMGVSLLKYRILAFVIATVYAMIAGVLFVSTFSASTPTSWEGLLSLNILAAVILGGSISPAGIMLGSFFIFALDLIVLRNFAFFVNFPGAVMIMTGILMILIFAKFPGGLSRLVKEFVNVGKKLVARRKVYKYGEESNS